MADWKDALSTVASAGTLMAGQRLVQQGGYAGIPLGAALGGLGVFGLERAGQRQESEQARRLQEAIAAVSGKQTPQEIMASLAGAQVPVAQIPSLMSALAPAPIEVFNPKTGEERSITQAEEPDWLAKGFRTAPFLKEPKTPTALEMIARTVAKKPEGELTPEEWNAGLAEQERRKVALTRREREAGAEGIASAKTRMPFGETMKNWMVIEQAPVKDRATGKAIPGVFRDVSVAPTMSYSDVIKNKKYSLVPPNETIRFTRLNDVPNLGDQVLEQVGQILKGVGPGPAAYVNRRVAEAMGRSGTLHAMTTILSESATSGFSRRINNAVIQQLQEGLTGRSMSAAQVREAVKQLNIAAKHERDAIKQRGNAAGPREFLSSAGEEAERGELPEASDEEETTMKGLLEKYSE